MPLESGSSAQTISANIAELINSGYSREQAAAIAYKKAGDNAESQRMYDINGWFEIKRNPISKVGVFPYRGASIGASDPDRIYMVYRPPEELADPECVESFKLLPWVDEHAMLGPAAESETPEALPAEVKGISGVIGENVVFENGVLWGNIKAFSDSMACEIGAGKRELSAGYRCNYDFTPGVFNGQYYDAVQRNIRGNHLALVSEGRCGPDVAVLDHLTITFDAKDIEMADATNTPAGGGEGEMTLAEITAQLKALAPVVAQITQMQAMLQQLTGEPDGDEGGEEPVMADAAAGPGGAAEPAPAADAEPAMAAASSAMDAALRKLDKRKDAPLIKLMQDAKDKIAAARKAPRQLVVAVKPVTVDAAEIARSVRADLALCNKLYPQVSTHVGTFDASEMDSKQMAKYAVGKLGLHCADGAELVALQAYLHARPAPAPVGAMDAAPDGAGPISKQLAGV